MTIQRVQSHLSSASRGHELTEYHSQAAIAACHVAALTPEETDWEAILGHFETLHERHPSPIVTLNRAVAVAMVHGYAAGLHELEPLEREELLESYYLLPATRGEFHRGLGQRAEAFTCYQRALELVGTEPERRFLELRIASCRPV